MADEAKTLDLMDALKRSLQDHATLPDNPVPHPLSPDAPPAPYRDDHHSDVRAQDL